MTNVSLLDSFTMIFQERALALWARRTLVARFQKCRKADLVHRRATAELEFLDGVNCSSSHFLYKALRPKRPVNRLKGFKVPRPLPVLDGDSTDRYRGRVVKVWEKHFSAIESADLVSVDDYSASARPALQPAMLPGFDLCVLPTRADFENSLRALSRRKAPGYDGIGAELWQGDPQGASLRLYPLFPKSVARVPPATVSWWLFGAALEEQRNGQ